MRIRRIAAAFMLTGFVLIGVGFTAQSAPAETNVASPPAPGTDVHSPEQPQIIIPGSSSPVITQIAFLLVSIGGVLAAIPPIVKALRKTSSESQEEADRIRLIIDTARQLAADERAAGEGSQEDEGDDRAQR